MRLRKERPRETRMHAAQLMTLEPRRRRRYPCCCWWRECFQSLQARRAEPALRPRCPSLRQSLPPQGRRSQLRLWTQQQVRLRMQEQQSHRWEHCCWREPQRSSPHPVASALAIVIAIVIGRANRVGCFV